MARKATAKSKNLASYSKTFSQFSSPSSGMKTRKDIDNVSPSKALKDCPGEIRRIKTRASASNSQATVLISSKTEGTSKTVTEKFSQDTTKVRKSLLEGDGGPSKVQKGSPSRSKQSPLVNKSADEPEVLKKSALRGRKHTNPVEIGSTDGSGYGSESGSLNCNFASERAGEGCSLKDGDVVSRELSAESPLSYWRNPPGCVQKSPKNLELGGSVTGKKKGFIRLAKQAEAETLLGPHGKSTKHSDSSVKSSSLQNPEGQTPAKSPSRSIQVFSKPAGQLEQSHPSPRQGELKATRRKTRRLPLADKDLMTRKEVENAVVPPADSPLEQSHPSPRQGELKATRRKTRRLPLADKDLKTRKEVENDVVPPADSPLEQSHPSPRQGELKATRRKTRRLPLADKDLKTRKEVENAVVPPADSPQSNERAVVHRATRGSHLKTEGRSKVPGGSQEFEDRAKVEVQDSQKRKMPALPDGSSEVSAKRQSCPGVRIIGGRIYDSENGQTCHQCRQKTLEYMAPCRRTTENKACSQKFCPKCLLNRYGEKVEDVVDLEVWSCPRCRGICNCSICMKKQGLPPTGSLTHTAKATGYGSVAELLEHHQGAVQEVLRPAITSKQDVKGKAHSSQTASQPGQCATVRSHKRARVEKLMAMDFDSTQAPIHPTELRRPSGKEPPVTVIETGTPACNGDVTELIPPSEKPMVMRMPKRARWVPTGILAKVDDVIVPVPPPRICQIVQVEMAKDSEKEILLPEGKPLLAVAGIELPANAIGPALQILEFCCAFGKLLGIKSRDAEKALTEIAKGPAVKFRLQLVQIHVRLMSVILDENEAPYTIKYAATSKNSWLEALKKHFRSKLSSYLKGNMMMIKDASVHPPSSAMASSSSLYCRLLQDGTENIATALESGADGYASLPIHEKLQLLSIICDDVLSTSFAREHIHSVIAEVDGIKKEQREEALAAKEKAKKELERQKAAELKRLLAVGRNKGPQLQQLPTYLTRMRAEAAEEVAGEASCSKTLHKKDAQRCDGVRTEVVVWDKGERACWKLKGVNDRSSVVLQDISNVDGIQKEAWSVYSENDERVMAAFVTQKKKQKHLKRSRKPFLPTLPSQDPGEPSSTEALEQIPRQQWNAESPLLDTKVETPSSDEEAEFVGSDEESVTDEEPEEE